MIIKGKSRSGPAALAAHLLNAEKNENVTVLDIRGTVADDLRGALVEMDAIAVGTRCQKPLYHASISPGPPHKLTERQRAIAFYSLEVMLGLDGHPRVIVLHQKNGREHMHVVWSRIDTDTMTSVSDSHNYRIHEEVSRNLEMQFKHERVQGAHVERDGVERPDRTPTRAELRQEERTGIKGSDVKIDVSALFRASDSAGAFQAAIEEKGYILAKGDRRDFVIVDHKGGIHSLARRIDGMKAAQLREYMSSIDPATLPTAAYVQDAIIDHAVDISLESSRKTTARHEEWRRRWREANARADAQAAKDYGRGEDYVSQSQAALKDHTKRQGEQNEDPRPKQPDQPSPAASEVHTESVRKKEQDELLRRQADETTARQNPATDASSDKQSAVSTSGEMTDEKQARLDRLLNTVRDDDRSAGRDDTDRQPRAPGGGRTRSR